MDRPPRTLSPALAGLLALSVMTVAGGSQCHRPQYNQTAIYGPRVLTENPKLEDVIQVVNANSALIRSLYTTDATMSVPGAPSLRANLALERERKLRLRAETAITGPELDLGSNDELFWFWVKRNPPPTLYYCRHDKFASSPARQFVPADPEWLLDAVGLATFDAYHQHSAPQRTANGNLEIVTNFTGPQGPMSKKTVVDASRGFILEQHLYDARGTLTASALASRHWRDPATGAVVPQQVKITWPATQFSLEFDVKQWRVNSIPADPTQLFTLPSYPGWAVVDLGDPNLRMPGATAPGSPSLGAAPPAAGTRPGPAGDLLGYVPTVSPQNPGTVFTGQPSTQNTLAAPQLTPIQSPQGFRRY